MKASAFPPETAGSLMTAKVPVIKNNASIATAIKTIQEKAKQLETINYIYVISQDQKLKGVLSIKDIFRQPPQTPIKKIMVRELISVRPHTDQERVALLALQHNLKAIPVVDRSQKLLGVVPSDVILHILNSENIEDSLRSAGLSSDFSDHQKTPLFSHFRRRIPWLFLGLLGGVLAAMVVESFEAALQTSLALAAFIPAIVYMADAVGTQVQTIFIRSLTVNNQLNFYQYFSRETGISFLVAAVLSLTISLISLFFWHSVILALVLGSAFFATVLTASMVALFLPWLFYKLKADPAVATGPLATIVRDILSLVIYFELAQTILHSFNL